MAYPKISQQTPPDIAPGLKICDLYVPMSPHEVQEHDPVCFQSSMLQVSRASREFLAHASFVEGSDGWIQVCSIWDSASNTCLIRPHLVSSHWKWATRDKRMVTGVGGKRTECHGIVIVPLKTTHNSSTQPSTSCMVWTTKLHTLQSLIHTILESTLGPTKRRSGLTG